MLHNNRGGEKAAGVLTGLRDLDAITTGLGPGELVVLAARPSMGKSALARNIARNVAVDQGRPVAFFSLEMSKTEVIDRMLYAEAGVAHWRRRQSDLGPEEAARVEEARQTLQAALIYIEDDASLTVPQMRAAAIGMKSERGDLGLLVVDYFDLMVRHGEERDRCQLIMEDWRGLKDLARELSAPVLVLSQLALAIDTRADPRPLPSDIRGVEADLLLLLYRDEVYYRDTGDKGTADVTAARVGRVTGTCKLAFHSGSLRFADL